MCVAHDLVCCYSWMVCLAWRYALCGAVRCGASYAFVTFNDPETVAHILENSRVLAKFRSQYALKVKTPPVPGSICW